MNQKKKKTLLLYSLKSTNSINNSTFLISSMFIEMNGPPFNGINLISGSPTIFTIPWHHLLLQAGRNDQFFNSKGGGEEREKKYQRKESSIFASPCKGTRRGINSNFWMDGGPRFCRKKKKKKRHVPSSPRWCNVITRVT